MITPDIVRTGRLRGQMSPYPAHATDAGAFHRLPAIFAVAGMIATFVILASAPAAMAGTYTVVSCPAMTAGPRTRPVHYSSPTPTAAPAARAEG
jgi:hypothetical protein